MLNFEEEIYKIEKENQGFIGNVFGKNSPTFKLDL